MEFEVLDILEKEFTEFAFGKDRENNIFVNGANTNINFSSFSGDAKVVADALRKELLKGKFIKKVEKSAYESC